MSDDESKFRADEKCYHYYARLESWTREEAAALLLKLDPRSVLVRDSLTRLRPADEWQPYCDLLEMIRRARRALPYERRLKPGIFISWAKHNGLHPPQELIDAVDAVNEPKPSKPELFSDVEYIPRLTSQRKAGDPKKSDTLHHKTKTSLLKLIAGMALRGYGYDPTLKQNQAISDIETDLQLLNIPLSDDTIRRWIGEACDLIDWETVDENVKPRKS